MTFSLLQKIIPFSFTIEPSYIVISLFDLYITMVSFIEEAE